jgi:gamma-glutamyltranspeptidase/glutathione hydrolase
VRNAKAEQLPGAFLQTYCVNATGSSREALVKDGRAPQKGEVFANPALADTLATLAEKGRDAFYRGEIADKIDAFMREHGGYLRKVDFEQHSSTWVDPVSVDYRGYDVFELPPNGQGIAALQMLNILEGYDLAAMGLDSPEALHVMIEAKKLAFEDRAKFYADPEFAKIPLKGLLSKAYAAERRKLIDPLRAARTCDSGNPALHDGDTIYLTTADAEGSMVR